MQAVMATYQPQGTRMAKGSPLDDGYLNGERITAGSRIYLLMAHGWQRGRFEYDNRQAYIPLFYLALPGCDDAVHFVIPNDALLAWPEALGDKRAGRFGG